MFRASIAKLTNLVESVKGSLAATAEAFALKIYDNSTKAWRWPSSWRGRMHRQIIPAQPPAKYHRVKDMRRAQVRYLRYARNSLSPTVPRHIAGNFKLASEQLRAMKPA
jgi:hypothetical protein